tara:strand:+ start:624 stop:797 length:174 start_codon:yes stop_codon:yes gene_type:complete
MKTYEIQIAETRCQTVWIKADSIEDAKYKYNNTCDGELISDECIEWFINDVTELQED